MVDGIFAFRKIYKPFLLITPRFFNLVVLVSECKIVFANFLFFEYNEKVKSTGTSVQPGEEDEKVFYSD